MYAERAGCMSERLFALSGRIFSAVLPGRIVAAEGSRTADPTPQPKNGAFVSFVPNDMLGESKVRKSSLAGSTVIRKCLSGQITVHAIFFVAGAVNGEKTR